MVFSSEACSTFTAMSSRTLLSDHVCSLPQASRRLFNDAVNFSSRVPTTGANDNASITVQHCARSKVNTCHIVPTAVLLDSRLRYTCRMSAGRCHRVATWPLDVPSDTVHTRQLSACQVPTSRGNAFSPYSVRSTHKHTH